MFFWEPDYNHNFHLTETKLRRYIESLQTEKIKFSENLFIRKEKVSFKILRLFFFQPKILNDLDRRLKKFLDLL